MRFTVDGKEYVIVFHKRDVHGRRETQAGLYEIGKNPARLAHEVMRATVRCYFKDQMTHEEGRRQALRRLTPFIAKPLRAPLWAAYFGRKRGREAQ